jgi:hypothetical protein
MRNEFSEKKIVGIVACRRSLNYGAILLAELQKVRDFKSSLSVLIEN